MFTQASLTTKYDMSPAPQALLRIVRAYETQHSIGSEFRVWDGLVELSVPVPGFKVLRIDLRLSKDGTCVSLFSNLKNFSCLMTDQYATETGRVVLTHATIHLDAPVPTIEIQVDLARLDLIDEALDALRENWGPAILH